MPPPSEPVDHVKPYVHVSLSTKALHFSISEIQSRMRLKDPDALDLAYTRTMMGFLLFDPQPKDIVMVGLGGGSLAKFCHRHLPAAHIEVTEINPHVIALRDEFLVPPDDERFKVLCIDGARFVRERQARCDVLLVDGFDSGGQPSVLVSQRFYDDCHDLLQPGGLLVVNLHRGHPRHAIHVDRIRRSFEGEVLVVDDGDLTNCVVLAGKGDRFSAPGAPAPQRPKGLGRAASTQLAKAYTLVESAWRAQWPARR